MAYMIRATGTGTVAFNGQEYTFDASELKQGPFETLRPQRFSEDDVECSASFIATDVATGQGFVWIVYYDEKFFSTGGVEITGSDVTPGEIVRNFLFDVVFDDDEDSFDHE